MGDLPRATIVKNGMQIDFFWMSDRFGHTMSVVRDGEAQVVWRSVHESQHSPAFQELHEQFDSEGRNVLFLSGAGGHAHWSMSVEQDLNGICFDVAARVSRPPTERVIEYLAESAVPQSMITLRPHEGVGTVEFQARRCTFRPQHPVGGDMPMTLRWKYAAAAASDRSP